MGGVIPYGRQSIDKADIDAVNETLVAPYLTQGPRIVEFEASFAKYIGSEYAVALANGTAALHLSAMVLGVKPGDKVITTPITFSASANCIRYCGGEVVFADIDPESYLIDINSVRKLLEAAPKGTYKGIVPVEFAGRAVDLEAFRQLADEFGLWLLEDSCHAPGGFFRDASGTAQNCGNGKFADLSIFSFHPVKHIASGEGGMVTTNNKQFYEQLMILRTHGITRNQQTYCNDIATAYGEQYNGEKEWPGWYMEMQSIGYNYRLTDIQAALGNSQLKKAKKGLSNRRAIAKRYHEAFEGKEYILGHSGDVQGHAYHLYVIEVNDRAGLYNYLREHGVFAQVHYVPVHQMPFYKTDKENPVSLENSEKYYSRCLSLPMFPTLTDDEQEFVINIINQFYH